MNYYEIALTISVVALLIICYYLQKQVSDLYRIMQQQNIVNDSMHKWNKQLTDTIEKAVEHSLQVEAHVNKNIPELFKMVSETNDDLLTLYNRCHEHSRCKPKGEL